MRFFILILISVLTITSISQAYAEEINMAEKFDPGFYDRLQMMVDRQRTPPDGTPYGATQLDDSYNVIIYVARHNVNSDLSEDTDKNKEKIVSILNGIGARDIMVAKSLSFITATVPIDSIAELAKHDIVYQIGDGEERIEAHVDKAKKIVLGRATDIPIYNEERVTGKGIKVSVVDGGINSIYLNDKVTKRIYCPSGTCTVQNGLFHGPVLHDLGLLNGTSPTTHGTQVAQIIAASGMSQNNGIAPGVTLLDALSSIEYPNHRSRSPYPSGTAFAHTLDWSYTQGADVINISMGSSWACYPAPIASTLNIIVDEVVEKGIVFVTSAGNRGLSQTGNAEYNTITAFSCAHNSITVGGIDSRTSSVKMHPHSSRGPSHDRTPILKPDLVAPAVHFNLLDSSIRDSHRKLASGTSFASPLVAGTVALMLEGNTHLEPHDVKALLLLGANWTGPVPCTSKQFEQNNPRDNCSFAKQPTNKNTANGKDGLKILNNVGFGILNTKQAVQYANQPELYISDQITSKDKTKMFTINITDTTKPVKIILNWLVEPPGDIIKKRTGIVLFPIIDLNFNVQCASGQTLDATSRYQTTEFVVFKPTAKGKCNITVTAPDTGRAAYFETFNFRVNNIQQDFTIASTVPFVKNTPLTIPIPIQCGAGTSLVNGTCVSNISTPPQCEQGRLVANQCVPNTPPPQSNVPTNNSAANPGQQPIPQPINKPVPANNNSASLPQQDDQIIQINISGEKYDTNGRTIDLYHGINNRMRIDTAYQDGGTTYHINDKAYITIFRDTWITNKQFEASGGQYCYVGDLLVGQDADISQNHTNSLNIQFRKSTDPDRCIGSPNIDLTGKLVLGKEVYVRFVGANGQTPFYYNGSDIIEILKCSSANFTSTTNTLKDSTEICYGKDGNDTILVSKILAVFGVTTNDIPKIRITPPLPPPPQCEQGTTLVEDQCVPNTPPPPVQTINPMAQLLVQDYNTYKNIINGDQIDQEKSGIVHKMLPKCVQDHSPIKQSTKILKTGDIQINYTSPHNFADGTTFTTIKNDAGTFTAISSDPTLISSNTKKFEYTNVIPYNTINTDNDHLGIRSFFFIPSNTINSTMIFSNNSNGMPLFYKAGSIAIQLPNATSGTTFVSGTLDGLTGTVYVPSGNTITLDDPVFCEFGVTKPKQVAKIFDLDLKFKNVTQGLEVTYQFEKQTFQSGTGTVKEVKPNILHWIAQAGSYFATGETTDKITKDYTFTIPLRLPNNYDIIIYGTNKQESKIQGMYRDSSLRYGEQFVNPMPMLPLPVIQITLPAFEKYDTNGRTIDLYHGINNRMRIDTAYQEGGTAYHINDKAEIIMFRDTWITNKQFTASGGQYCYVGDLRVNQNTTLDSTTLKVEFRKSADKTRCNGSPEITLDDKLILDKEIFVRFVGADGKTPFYNTGTDVDIPKCSNENFDSTNQLIGNTEICYGKDNNDTILVSKILATFGVK